MARVLVQSEKLTDAVLEMVREYHEDVSDQVYKVGRKAIKELERKTIDTAPIGRRGEFRTHIASKSERDRLDRMKHIWYVKAPEYRLTHLLVNGHKLWWGGRAKANPFLKDALKDVLDDYIKDVEKAIKNGG